MKFKVGDRVKCIETDLTGSFGCKIYKDEIYTVTNYAEFDGGGESDCCNVDNQPFGFFANKFELLTPPTDFDKFMKHLESNVNLAHESNRQCIFDIVRLYTQFKKEMK